MLTLGNKAKVFQETEDGSNVPILCFLIEPEYHIRLANFSLVLLSAKGQPQTNAPALFSIDKEPQHAVAGTWIF